MTDQLPPAKIALVLDGEVLDVLHTDERLAAIFLSQPTIVDATEYLAANPNKILVGGTWDGTEFVPLPVEQVPNVLTKEQFDAIQVPPQE